MSTQYILLYSDQCVHSQNLIKEMYKYQHVYNNIVKQCIDDGKVKIPSNIKIVPALIIKHNGNFQTLQGKQVFEWLRNSTENKQQQHTQSNNLVNQHHGIESYDPITMNNSLSDSFSILNNFKPMSHCYQFINSQEGFSSANHDIVTPNENELTSIKSDTDKRLEQLMQRRNMEIPKGIQRQ